MIVETPYWGTVSPPVFQFNKIRKTPPDKDTILANSRLAENGCWEWMGAGGIGRPIFNFNGKTVTAYRLAYEIWNGPIPQGSRLVRCCGNRSCCNPNHTISVKKMPPNQRRATLRGNPVYIRIIRPRFKRWTYEAR
jgi:hypothetical protein